MHDKQSHYLNTDYFDYIRMVAKTNDRHNEEYRNLCSEITLPNSTMETSILRTSVTEEDNTILLLL